MISDPYRSRASIIHGLDARVKAVLSLGFILMLALLLPGAWPIYILCFALLWAAALLSELGVRFIWTRALLALPFALAALPLLFTVAGPPLIAWNAFGRTVTITTTGTERLLSIVVKSWLSVQVGVMLVSATPFPQLLAALRALRMPRLLVAIVGLMWRYLFVLSDEALRLLRARAARSGDPDGRRRVGGSVLWRAHVTGGMAGNLFLRAFDRADRIYAAMLARGYDGEIHTLPFPPLTGGDWGILGMGIGVLALLGALSLLW